MARFVAFFFLAAVVCAIHAFPQHDISQNCGPNEIFKSCANSCEATCQNPEPKMCNLICRMGCECTDGFLRSHNGGKCIPKPQCLLRD